MRLVTTQPPELATLPGSRPPAPDRPTSEGPRTGLIAAAMILFWPVGLAALFAAARAARAEGAGDAFGARHEAWVARRRSRLAVTLGSILLTLLLATSAALVAVVVQHAPALQTRLANGVTPPIRTGAAAGHRPLPVNLLELRTGDCFLTPTTEQGWEDLSTVEVLPCGDEHDAVVIAVHEHDEAGYPGREAVEAAAWRACGPASWQYMGADTPQRPDVRPWMPNASGWAQGYRASPCILVASEPVRGSLRDRPDLVGLTAPGREAT